jgi:Potassium-transporting ATPase A subunit
MEGKDVRFGIASSTRTAVVTSNTTTGSNNSMHDSYTSFAGLVLLTTIEGIQAGDADNARLDPEGGAPKRRIQSHAM